MTMRDNGQIGSMQTATRQLTCARCGGAFGCTLDGDCWCAEQPVRLPMPTEDADCLCPRCLREAARHHAASASKA